MCAYWANRQNFFDFDLGLGFGFGFQFSFRSRHESRSGKIIFDNFRENALIGRMENVIRPDHINTEASRTEASRDCKPLKVPFDSVDRIASALERIADTLESVAGPSKKIEVGREIVGTQSTGEGSASASKPSTLFDHVAKAGPPRHPTADELAVAYGEFCNLFKNDEELQFLISLLTDTLSTAGVEKFSDLETGTSRLHVLRCLRRLAAGFVDGGIPAATMILETIVSESQFDV